MVTFAGNDFLSFYTDYVGGTNRFIVLGFQQWGLISGATNSHPTITLPIALMEKYFFAAGKYINYTRASNSEYGYVYDKTLTDFKVVYGSGPDMVWLVIGQ